VIEQELYLKTVADPKGSHVKVAFLSICRSTKRQRRRRKG
jgi:hypothetical protein